MNESDRIKNGVPHPNKTIIIINENRCGSNYLCALMSATGKLGNPNEYFNPNMTFDNASTIYERYQAACKTGMTANGIMAIKLFTNHWNMLEHSIVFSELFPNRYWIWLRRQDLLAQSISHVIAMQTRAWTSQVKPDTTPIYSSDAISYKLKDIAINESRWRIFFSRNGISPLTLWHEDLITQSQDIIIRIAAYVGVEIGQKDINTDVYTRIQRTSLNEEWKQKFISEMSNVNYLDQLQSGSSYLYSLRKFWQFLKGKLPAPD